jgi:hypothetical protein
MAEMQCTEQCTERCTGIRFVRRLGLALALSLALIGACRSPSRDGHGLPSGSDGRGGAAAVSAAGGSLGTSPPAPRGP